MEATADDQRPVRWEGAWGLDLEATADDQRQRCLTGYITSVLEPLSTIPDIQTFDPCGRPR